jgi:hypothetical protein
MTPQHNIDYVLIDSDDGKKTGIGIKTGKFKGVLYHYGKARITEEEYQARMTFSYTIVSSPFIPIDELIENEEFHTLIGDILTDILMSQERANEKIRTYNFEEFDIQ